MTTPQLYRALGRTLRAARGSRSLRDVSAVSGMCISHISETERGEVQTTLTALVNLAGANNLSIFELFRRAQALLEKE